MCIFIVHMFFTVFVIVFFFLRLRNNSNKNILFIVQKQLEQIKTLVNKISVPTFDYHNV